MDSGTGTEMFDVETVKLSPRERITGALIQEQLVKIYEELKEFPIDNERDLEIFRERFRQFIVDQISNLNEYNYDIFDVLRKFPDYSKFIEVIGDKNSEKKQDMVIEQEKELMRMTKTQLIDIIQKGLLKPFLKLTMIHAMVSDVSIKSFDKVCELKVDKMKKEDNKNNVYEPHPFTIHKKKKKVRA